MAFPNELLMRPGLGQGSAILFERSKIAPAHVEGRKGLRPYLNRFIPEGKKELLPGNSRKAKAGGESHPLGASGGSARPRGRQGRLDFTFPSLKLAHAG
jgi:hypothetical protein